MSNPAPGWYPDPAGSPAQRWWNGTTWSESTQQAAPQQPAPNPYVPMQPFASAQPYGSGTQQYSYYGEPLRAPEGTNPNTPQAWIIALWPLLGLLSVVVYGSLGYLNADNLYGSTMTGDLINIGISVVAWLALVGVAYLDYQELARRQVPKPFHWAFAFIPFPIVYVIGRTVVVYSRTRRGLAPLFLWIGLTVGVFLSSFVGGILIGIASYNSY